MSKTLEPNTPLTQESLRAEATGVEKLRRELAGGTASPSRMAEFAKRQKAYLDRKIEFEKLKRVIVELPAKKPAIAKIQTKAAPVAPEKTPKVEDRKPVVQKPAAEKAPETRRTKSAEDKTSPVTPPPSRERKSSARWIWWLLLATVAAAVAYIYR